MPLRSGILNNYPNDIFIETGTYLGEGVLMALEAGFKRIVTIELSKELYRETFIKFGYHPYVKSVYGDSAKVLPQILKHLNEPVTFWLDSHFVAPGTRTALGEVNSPLLFELEVIKNHHIKTHTILIDDMRCWKNKPNQYPKDHSYSNNFDPEILREKLLEINPDYNISYIDNIINGKVEANDIIVAKPK
jgi:hypothetical protein